MCRRSRTGASSFPSGVPSASRIAEYRVSLASDGRRLSRAALVNGERMGVCCTATREGRFSTRVGGTSFIGDVAESDLWLFPHSTQGLGPDGCEFLLVFDEGIFSVYNLPLSGWLAHTPNFRVHYRLRCSDI